MKLKDAMLLFENEMNEENKVYSDDICLISKEKFKEKYTLECNHSFEYPYLYNELCKQYLETKKLKCPYCRRYMYKVIPFIDSINPVTNKPIVFDKQLYSSRYFILENKYKCQYTPKSGKSKGIKCCENAHKFSHGTFCKTHMKYNETIKKKESRCKCSAIKKDGNQCTKFVNNKYDNGEVKSIYCTIHAKMYLNC